MLVPCEVLNKFTAPKGGGSFEPFQLCVSETDDETIVFVRTIPGTALSLDLEPQELVLSGTLPDVPDLPGEVQRSSPLHFRKSIMLDHDIYGINRDQQDAGWVLRIAKFPT